MKRIKVCFSYIHTYIHIIKQLCKLISAGDASINLLKIDPIDAGTFTLKQGADNPVNIDLTFSNNKITGVGDASAYKVR